MKEDQFGEWLRAMSSEMSIGEKLADKKEKNTTPKDNQDGVVGDEGRANVDGNLGIMSVTDCSRKNDMQESDCNKEARMKKLGKRVI